MVKSPLVDGDVVFLSKIKVFYALYPTLPTDCSPYFADNYKKASPIKSDSITVNRIVRGDWVLSEGEQIHPEKDDTTPGNGRAITQASDQNYKPQNGLIV